MSTYRIYTPRLSLRSKYTDWVNQLTAARSLTRTTSLTLTTVYVVRKNGQIEAGDIGAGDRMVESDYSTWITNLGLSWAMTEHLGAFFYGEHLNRYSDDPDLEFSRDTVGVNLVYRHDI